MNTKRNNFLNYAVSIIAGLALGLCFYTESSTPTIYKSALSLVLLLIGTLSAYKLLSHIISPFLLPLSRSKSLLFLSLATLIFAILSVLAYRMGKTTLPQSLSWKLDAGPNKGKEVALVENLSWQKRIVGAMVLHSSDNPDNPASPWEWRTFASLPEEVKSSYSVKLHFEIAKPEWSVLDQSGQPVRGYDGVTVSIHGRKTGVWQELTRMHIDPFSNSDHRRWIPIDVTIPQGSDQVAVEVSPGPLGSNNYNDTLLIHLTSILPFNYLTNSLKGLFLGLAAAGLIVAMALGVATVIAEDEAVEY